MYIEIKYLLKRDLWDREILLIKSLGQLNISLQEFKNVIIGKFFVMIQGPCIHKQGRDGRPAYDPIMILKILFDKINYYIKKNKCIIRSGSIVEVPFNTMVKKKMSNSKTI